jgi:Outer membrane protein beta-barrel domain
MKKRIGVLLAILVLTGTQLFAQSFQLGIKGGGNLSDFLSEGSPSQASFSAIAGWNAGVFLNFWLGNHFAIAPELLYTTEGAGIKTTTAGDNGTTVTLNNNLNLRYVSLPLMAKLRFTGGFYIEAGPEVSLNVSSSTWEDQSVKNVTNNAELGAAAGIGYQSPIGLGVSLRYTVGLTTVDNTNEATWGDINMRNSSFSLDLFWTLFNNRRLAENW